MPPLSHKCHRFQDFRHPLTLGASALLRVGVIDRRTPVFISKQSRSIAPDVRRGAADLVHLNPPGRKQAKKHRPTVKMPQTLRFDALRANCVPVNRLLIGKTLAE